MRYKVWELGWQLFFRCGCFRVDVGVQGVNDKMGA